MFTVLKSIFTGTLGWVAWIVVGLAIGVGLGWYGRAEVARNDKAAWELTQAKEQIKADDAWAKAVQDAQVLATNHWMALREKETENAQLYADVESARKRLRVRVLCPGTAPIAPAGSLGNGDFAELDPLARQDYRTLRSALTLAKEKIDYLQDYVRAVQKACGGVK